MRFRFSIAVRIAPEAVSAASPAEFRSKSLYDNETDTKAWNEQDEMT